MGALSVCCTETESVSSRAYRLIEPGIIRETRLQHEYCSGQVVVEPTMASICHADLRYYTGQRRPETLRKKLPMALLHEGIGTVVGSKSTGVREGERVAIVPNLPYPALTGIATGQCCPACRLGIGDNYCQRGCFLGSGFDGIAQSRLVLPDSCAVPIPGGIPDRIALLAELSSVSYRAVRTVADRLHDTTVAVFGDGPVGYLTAALLHHVYGLDRSRLIVYGAVDSKLEQFAFTRTALVHDMKGGEAADIVFECTGGRFSESALNQAIDIITPGGIIVMMGVTEERVPINTRDALEKGVTLIGTSRSSADDFRAVLKAMEHLDYQDTLTRLLPKRATCIRTADDFNNALEAAAQHRHWEKTLLELEWQ